MIKFNKGIKITCFGNAIAATNTMNITLTPGKFFLANAYPAKADVAQTKNVVITEINTELKNHLNVFDVNNFS